jgi:nitrile hydratase accessory protein
VTSMNTDTDNDEARQQVETLLGTLPHRRATWQDEAEPAFDSPWEIRVFALAVASHQAGRYDWVEFQRSLVGSIERWESADRQEPWSYYDRWMEALEDVLVGRDLLSGADLDERTRIVLSAPKNLNHHHAQREPVMIDQGRRA